MKPRPNPILRLSAALALACVGSAHAADLTWDAGSSSNWNTTEDNWTTVATWNNGTPDSAIFGSTGVGTVTLTEGISVNDITFNTAGYTVTGNTLTVLGGMNSLITANADATISSVIAGGRLVKQGSATLSVTGANTYGDGTVIDNGTLEITSIDGASSNIGSTWLAMDNTSTLRYIGTGSESTSRDLWINNAAGTRTFDIANAGASLTLTGAGGQINKSIRKIGDGTLVLGKVVSGGETITVDGGKLSLAAVNTSTGNTIVNSGILEVTSTGKLYGGGHTTVPTITVASGATLRLNGWSWDAAGSIANLDYNRDRLVVNGGTLEYTGASNFNSGDPGSSSRNFTIGTGGATLKASSTSGQTWTISVGSSGNILNAQGLTLDGAGAGEIQKVIEGSGGSLTKNGNGMWTLSGVNTYSGNTTVNTGTLALSGGGSIASSGELIVDGTLDVTAISAGTFTVGASQTLSGSGTVNASGKTLSIVGTHAVGSSPGQQDVTGNLSYASGSIFEWDLNAATSDPGANTANSGTYDQVDVTGDLTGGGSTFKIVLGTNAFSDAFWNTNKSWSNIFSAGTAFDLGTIFTAFSGSGVASSGLVADQGSFTITGTSLTWTAVPEPTSALAGLLITAGLLRRRR